MLSRWTVKTVLATLPSDSGEMLSAVEYAGGTFGILRNGEPLTVIYWPEGGRDRCLAALRTLAGKPTRKPQLPHGAPFPVNQPGPPGGPGAE
jgi:hypothetical protein